MLSDYYLPRGYPAGQWFGAGAEALGLAGAVTPAQMNALFGEGRHPHADAIEAEMIADGASAAKAMAATKLGRRFPQYSALDHMRSKVSQAYKDYNREHDRPIGAPIPAHVRAELRRGVQLQAYRDDHDGHDPDDEKAFRRWLAEQQRALKTAVSGFEMVFAPDKSVSITWAMAPPEDREQIADLVRQAARDTLSYVQRQVAFTRSGAMGEAQVDVNGITAALFEHWDSRASDPHLHIHALISNKVQRSDDGEWTALDGRTVHAAGVTASEYFDSRLRDLFRAHGARWTQRGASGVDLKRPVWQLEGVPVELVKEFSQRHTQFEAARAERIATFTEEHGREPSPKEIFEINRKSQYDHRPGKQPPQTLDEHTRAWRAQAETVVAPLVLDGLVGRVFASGQVAADEVDIAELARTTRAVVADNYAHFSWWNLAAEAHRQSAHLTVPDHDRERLIDTIVTTALQAPDTLALTGPAAVEEPASLRRRDGESVFVEHRSTRYTTTATLAAEQDLVAWARETNGHRLRTDTVDKALQGQGLNTGQERMVRSFARSGRRVQLALAPAGAGKTSAMRVFATAWRRTGHRVYAFAPSARAAQELGTSIGARGHTLHQLTTTQALGFAHRAFPMVAGDLVIIDEAAMAGTHTLHAVVKYALNKGADVRLIGDDAQLAAVEAGGAIRLLAHDVGAIRFREIVRFRGPDRREQATASLHIREGNPRGLKYYFDHGRVQDGSIETMRAAAHAAWRADLDAGASTLLIVPTNEDTIALNREARQRRQRSGDLQPGPEVALHDTTHAGRGDWIVTRHNERLMYLFGGADFVKNGDTWQIIRVHHNGSLTVKHRAHGGGITLPAEYVRANVELAYAATVNRVQGMTSKGNAHLVVPPSMTREQFYPGITRAMRKNFLYVVTHHHVIDQHQETPDPQDPKAVLTGVLHHSGAEVSATETLRAKLAEAESLGTLVLRYNYTATYRDEHRYRAALTRHTPEALEYDSEPALIQTLRNAHDLGWEPDHLIPAALGRTTLTGTNDPGAVLQSRITKHLDKHAPPTPIAEPTREDITRWRGIFDAIAPTAPVEDPTWEPIWHHAAGALAAGIDIDAAITSVAHQLTARPRVDPMPDHRYAEHALTRELANRIERGDGHHRALPWLARPDFTAARHYPGHAEYLTGLNTAITGRVEELRANAIRNTPGWATKLGPRPNNPITAAEWDELVGLAAAWRETFHITSDNPNAPLGEQPDSRGAKAHAWQQLTTRWNQYPNPPQNTPASEPHLAHLVAEQHDTATDNNTEREGTDEALFIDDLTTLEQNRYQTETLDQLTRRYELIARAGDAERYLDLLAEHAPETINQPAEPALLHALANAQDTGWQAHRLLPTLTSHTTLAQANDPAALLTKLITNYTSTRQPPAPTATPTPEDTARWRTLITETLPAAAVNQPEWDLVWRHAAGGQARGVDPDTALARAAHQLTNQPTETPQIPDHRAAGHALVAELAAQQHAGHGHQPALPWLARPELTGTADDQTRRERLDTVNAEIHARTQQLRANATHQPPIWARPLGPRPTEPDAARRWDHTLAQTAAYRETFHITSNNPHQPLGPNPGGNNARARAWSHLNQQWRTLMTNHTAPDPEDTQSETLEATKARRDLHDTLNTEFRDAVAEQLEHQHDDEDERRAEHEDELDDLEASRQEDMHTGLGY